MLSEEKVSLPAMRDVLAKIELVPVNFEREVDLFQKKMLSAQNWLAKARKCIPKRRVSRRGGGAEPKKMDLDAIRALVDDAPCDDSAEMFEMQDLLECADEWAEKVKQAIEGGAEIQLDELKELLEEGSEMPVEMEEQKYLEAEIAARDWCVKAAAMLAAKKSLKSLESIAEDAKSIRARIYPKKQSRWKPQVERDIHAAIDTARRWVNEVRDAVGQSAFDRLLSNSASSEHGSHSSRSESSSHPGHEKAKKPIETIAKLIEKSDRLVVNVSSYVGALKELQERGFRLQDEVKALLKGIGCLADLPSAEQEVSVATVSNPSVEGDPKHSDEAVSASTVVPKSGEGPAVDARDFVRASAMLDRVYALPFHFEEGLQLEKVILAEKDWSQRVKDALPPRQSRKKRQAKNPITLAQLEGLQSESAGLRFHFPEELKTLAKELEELNVWRVKARAVVETPVAEKIVQVVPKLRDYDLAVYERLQAAKDKLTAAREDSCESVSEDDLPSDDGQDPKVEPLLASNGTADLNMTDVSGDVRAPQHHASANGVATKLAATITIVKTADSLLKATSEVKPAEPLAPIDVETIMSQLRIESGCMQKQKTDEAEGDSSGETKSSSGSDAVKETSSMLEPVLAMAEQSLEDITVLENRDERVSALETLELTGDASSSAFTDEVVKALESWQEQITQVVDEGELLSAVAPEMRVLSTVVDLLGWLQSARSLFYDETLPLGELVVQGRELAKELKAIRSAAEISESTVDTLELMLFPLPHLEAQDAVVQSWTKRVNSCISEKRVRVKTLQSLMDEGNALLMEADAFKIIQDEVRKAKVWLSKLKKRVKALLTKRVMRLTLSIARSFVEEGEDVVIETAVFDLLKENVELASDWERRVLESGLESGQARIANLVSLLNEYDCAGLIIDMDMHREVLKSATERYCICRQPFDGLMIGCDFCDDWFHDNCIGMSKEKAEKVEDYTCPSCTILQDLSAALREVVGAQKTLWNKAEHVKDYEKHHGVLTRKLKREEKAVERSEMQLLSYTNQMNQLRTSIEEFEKAKIAMAGRDIKAAVTAASATATAGVATASTVAAPAAVASAASVGAPNQSPPQQLQVAAAAPPSSEVKAESGSATASAVPPLTAPAPSSTVAPATLAALQSSGFPSLYPNILLSGGNLLHATAPTVSLSTDTGKSTSNPSPGNAAVTIKAQLKQAMAGKVAPNMVDRIAALIAAGGDLDVQLPKMRAEHADAMSKAHEAQESLRLSKERLQLARDGLRELRTSHEARERGLPLAQDWVRRAVLVLNTKSLLSRSKLLQSGGYLPPEYEALVGELSQPDQQWAARVDVVFPEVRAYVRLLRLVGWSLVVVSLLQERPSRASLSSAIAYAAKHSLWESKTVSPLKGVLGRLDAWVAKVHKSVSKSGLSKAQKIPRLRLFLNEYSKLPLTCTPLADVLEKYIKAAEAETSGGSRASEAVRHAHDVAEAALITAFADAAAALSTVSPSASAAASSTSSASSAQAKLPRKRKSYTRKTSTASTSVKKSKKSPEASSTGAAAPHPPTASAPASV